MEKLENRKFDEESLSKALRVNGARHLNYKWYTSMDRALAFLLTGNLYLTNGEKWNDLHDRRLVEEKHVYSMCLSSSTRENMAMWMLYGEDRGRNGAIVNFLPSVMRTICNSSSIELGMFKESRFDTKYTLIKEIDKYMIFLTDILYIDSCKNQLVKVTCGDDHFFAGQDALEGEDVFYKNYAWAYEKECRLVLRLPHSWSMKAKKEDLTHVRLQIDEKQLRKMRERIVRSPVYAGSADFGKRSVLCGDVDWVI